MVNPAHTKHNVQYKSELEKSTGGPYVEPYSCPTTETFSGNNSGAKTLLEYNKDESLEIKEEITQDQDAKGEKRNQNYELKSCAINITHNVPVYKLLAYENQKLPELKQEQKNYKCETCARAYKRSCTLSYHRRFVCGVKPQFACEFCGKEFKHKFHLSRHVNEIHLKINLQAMQKRYYCDKCPRSYSGLKSLNQHTLLKHTVITKELSCDHCEYKTNLKYSMSKHMIARHLK
ncbi:zinc finger protein 117-like [Belonocnema kinseyi]|uniref:zinc finger protein 117-like n=1 Tax=Belonocnema kinseyi TaxID=2817044 RepID=UPI00143D41AF|nr:zinc finger protein 117-like [Belonocnema kinseyi]